MKLILIKIGKAYCAIKREGFFRGGKKVLGGFFAMFGKVGSGDVLIITGGVGDSARYRAHHHKEELELNGIKASVTVQDNPLLPSYANKFKLFIFHRTLLTPALGKLVQNIKKQGKEIVFETDDLVYDPKYIEHMDYFKKMNSLEKKLYENGVGGEILRDEYVKVCTTTTSFLASKLREEGKKVFIVPNKLSVQDLQWAEEILRDKQSKENTQNREDVVIGYFSGTISHNKDFATVVGALKNILQKYPFAKLFLAGPLDPDDELAIKFKDRIISSPYVPRKEHFKNVASVDINISPLEIGNPFCESKSELKFFEAGILKVPTVATATQTFREAVDDGVDGFVAKNEQEWMEKLSRLVEDKGLRIQMGERAKQKALNKYTTKNANNSEYYDFIKEKTE